MFLLGVEFVLASYAGVRVYEKVRAQKLNQTVLQQSDRKAIQINEILGNNDEHDKNLRYLQVSVITIGLAGLVYLNPIFLPLMLGSFTYIAFPYLRRVEHSIFVKKKVDGYVLYGIADFMTLGLGRIATASFAVTLLHSARFIVSHAEKRSKQSLFDVFGKQPAKVWLLVAGEEIEVPLAEVKRGDIVMVNTGDLVPVDGVIIKGIAAIDQHMLTGESQPAEKTIGDTVFASTQLMSGRIQVQVTTSGNETTVAKISEILKHSIDFKTNAQLKGEQWADSWNLPVLGLAFASMPVLGPVGTIVILNGHIAQTIRVVAPLSTLNYLSIASHKGILVKDGRVLEDLPYIDTFLFDKTGTLTNEEPEVGRILVYHQAYNEAEVLAYAAAAEGKLNHPIARAVIKRAQQTGVTIPKVDDADYTIGYGVSVKINGKLIQLGSHRFMTQEGIVLPDAFMTQLQEIHAAGHSLVMLAVDKQLAGILEMHAAVRSEVPALLTALRQRGVKHLAIVSGDHRQPTEKLAQRLGMDDYFYDVLPQHKADIVEQLQAQGRTVCFVGDGVNDTIAMKKANISISLSGATSVATDTAQIVLMDASLTKLSELFDISIALNKNLDKAWWLNVIPGVVTVFSAFMLRIDIILGFLISQTGLATGVVNAMLPLRQAQQEAQKTAVLQSKNHSD